MAELLRGDHAHVNLIPMNPVAHTPWTASPMDVIERFEATLREAGIATTGRRNRGQEIGAACGLAKPTLYHYFPSKRALLVAAHPKIAARNVCRLL